MRTLTNSLAILLLVMASSCGSGGGNGQSEKDKNKDKEKEKKEKAEKDKKEDKENKKMTMEKNGLKVYPIRTKNFPEAKLSLQKPEKNKVDPGKIGFKFKVENYELKKSTADADKHGLAESSKGQHIHWIRNNGPYHAEYESGFEKELKEGHHTILAFLSRSYHESVKNKDAYVLKQFTVGNPDGKKADLSQPQLFYSRPKGTYKGKDYKKLLLDFYLINVDELSKDGKKVRATINGETQFTFTKWKPYVIEGLKPGDTKIKLELLNKNGELVDSKYNQVVRGKIKLQEKEDSMASGDKKEEKSS